MVTDPIYLKNWELFLDPKLSTSLRTNRTCKISNYVFHFIGLLIQHIYLKITCTRDQHVLQRPMRFKYYSEAAFVWINTLGIHRELEWKKWIISCLSVNCLGLSLSKWSEGVSHHRQISSLLNRILAPFTCHQENSSITTLRASLPTTIIILSDVFLVGFLHICPPSEDSLFVARGSILFYAWIAWCGPNWVVTYATSGPFLKVLQDLVIPPL